MENGNLDVKVATTSPLLKSKYKKLERSATAVVLKDLLAGKDVSFMSSIRIDQLEAARFIERQAKILRFVCISAEMPTLAFLVEEIYYTAFDEALLRGRPDYRAFRELLKTEGSDAISSIG